MARNKLKRLLNERHTFIGTVDRLGTKSGFKIDYEPTIVINNLKLKGEDKVLTDHIWLKYGKNLKKANDNKTLVFGDVIQLDGRVANYEKGYKGYRDLADPAPIEHDYKIANPTKIKILKKNTELDAERWTIPESDYEFGYEIREKFREKNKN